MKKTRISQTLEELKASQTDLHQILNSDSLTSTTIDSSSTIDKVKKLMRKTDWDLKIECQATATINQSTLSRNLVAVAHLDLRAIMSHPDLQQESPTSPDNTFPVNDNNPLSVINEALLPHGYGIIISSTPELPEALRFVECYLDKGLIRFDCAHLFSHLLSPHLIVNQQKTVRYLCAPLEIVRTKHTFQQDFTWQEPDNSNLSLTVKLNLARM